MSDETKSIDHPSGRAIAVLDSVEQGNAAKKALIQIGVKADEIYVLSASDEAADIDTSADWFADTDELVEQYQKKLAAGATLISAPVKNTTQLKEVQSIYYSAGAHMMTHFGTFVTRSVDLDQPEREQPIDDK
ncbi:hypothetical protein [Thalassoglobus polymorphus]|uniref:Uncharacterized protein n=1 Tax=Thalassoglobus polymorphus TaxID=2527994 RepID=A0A517QKF9_9PLAN|nr:hypothetical protein [Thalassoglobus polymorphus]QDT32129.1 hypothetical protein Mal48_13710 [Thalassoglobus polymorphus]